MGSPWRTENGGTCEKTISANGDSDATTLLSREAPQIATDGTIGLDDCLGAAVLSYVQKDSACLSQTLPPSMIFCEPRIADLRETLLPVSCTNAFKTVVVR